MMNGSREVGGRVGQKIKFRFCNKLGFQIMGRKGSITLAKFDIDDFTTLRLGAYALGEQSVNFTTKHERQNLINQRDYIILR